MNLNVSLESILSYIPLKSQKLLVLTSPNKIGNKLYENLVFLKTKLEKLKKISTETKFHENWSKIQWVTTLQTLVDFQTKTWTFSDVEKKRTISSKLQSVITSLFFHQILWNLGSVDQMSCFLSFIKYFSVNFIILIGILNYA